MWSRIKAVRFMIVVAFGLLMTTNTVFVTHIRNHSLFIFGCVSYVVTVIYMGSAIVVRKSEYAAIMTTAYIVVPTVQSFIEMMILMTALSTIESNIIVFYILFCICFFCQCVVLGFAYLRDPNFM